MADIDRAVKALKNAVAAGDNEAATKIAKAIKQMQGGLPKREEITHTGGLSGHATQGALFGFGDEYMAGLSAVLGVQPDGQGGANWFQYDKPLAERYDVALGEIRRELGEYQDENPGKALTAQIVGGVGTAVAGGSALGVKAAATTPGRVAQVAGGGAAGGAVEGFGSGEGGFTNRLINSGIGAGVGAVFAPIVGFGLSKIARFAQDKGGKALRAVFTSRQFFDKNTGEITDAGRKRLQQLGYDANQLSREMLEAFERSANKAVESGVDDPAAVSRIASAERFGVPLTVGQATGDVVQSASEEGMRHGVRGAKAQQTLEAFGNTQSHAVEKARTELGDRVGSSAVDRVDAADAVIDGVRREAEAARQAGREAYSALEGAGAAISGDAVRNLGSQIANRVKAIGFSIGDDTPNARAAVSYLRNTLDDIGKGSVPFMSLERARQQLLRLRRAAHKGANGADQTVIGEVVEAFDGWLDGTITAALAQGDETVLAQAKEARGLWGKYSRTFLSKEGADNFIRKIVNDDLSPDQVAGWLYGGATTPGGGQTSLVARRIKAVLGEASQEWQMVKRAAWDHVTKAPEGKSYGPQKVANNLSEFIGGKGKALARELFSPEELRQISEFRDMLKVLIPPAASTNPSKSGYEIQRGFSQLLGTMLGASSGSPLGALAGREVAQGGSDFIGGLTAKAAARGIVKKPASVSTAIGSGVAAGGYAQEQTVR